MTIDLTKDGDKVICYIYKDYLKSRQDGVPKYQARRFSREYHLHHKSLSKWIVDDFRNAKYELGNNNLIQIWINGSFDLTDDGIIYMENRFKNNLAELTDFISKFIP